jgi:hypothetical protein
MKNRAVASPQPQPPAGCSEDKANMRSGCFVCLRSSSSTLIWEHRWNSRCLPHAVILIALTALASARGIDHSLTPLLLSAHHLFGIYCLSPLTKRRQGIVRLVRTMFPGPRTKSGSGDVHCPCAKGGHCRRRWILSLVLVASPAEPDVPSETR